MTLLPIRPFCQFSSCEIASLLFSAPAEEPVYVLPLGGGEKGGLIKMSLKMSSPSVPPLPPHRAKKEKEGEETKQEQNLFNDLRRLVRGYYCFILVIQGSRLSEHTSLNTPL